MSTAEATRESPLGEDAAVEGYRAALAAAGAGGVYDEVLGAAASGRGVEGEAWAPVLRTLAATAPTELRRRWERARLMIADHGVTYRAYGEKAGAERPWRLDPVPMVIDPVGWGRIEGGLSQRARLFEALLVDLHGPRRLLEEGVVPPALVLGNPGFFRPLRGLVPAGGRYLSLLAVDLARDADGGWVVLGDRSAAPGGVGHAIEHRVVVSRTLPVAFRKSRVRPLGGWFDRLRSATLALAPGVAEPRAVLLTPGSDAASHAEHAYLSRALGFTLVVPADLTVRRKMVYLKTLSGLERVHVIVRRVPDADCDPLELGGGTPRGGVPGLLEAQRAGNVAVTNAPGSGLVESPALAGYLPAACRFLLGEELILPPAPAIWGGDGELPVDLAEWVIKPAYAGPLTPGIGPGQALFGTTLGAEAGAALRAAMLDRPDAFAFQRLMPLSTTPSWRFDEKAVGLGDQVSLTPGRMVLRTFVAATDDGHAVMPGGLGRVSATADSRLTSMRRGGGAKDVWAVLWADEAHAIGPAWPAADRVPEPPRGPASRRVQSPSLHGVNLPSRVADNLFWLGRYAERAECTVRLLRAIGHRHDDPAEPHPRELRALMEALAVVTGVAEPEPAGAARATAAGRGGERVARTTAGASVAAGDVLAAIFDPRGPFGLASILNSCRGAGSVVRDRLSVDAWRILERLGRDFTRAADAAESVEPEDALSDAMELFDGMLLTLAAFAGHGHESFTHEEGWMFLDTGRRIERAVFTAELMRALLVRPVWLAGDGEPPGGARASEGLLLNAVLEVGVSAMTYRARHPALPKIVPVLDLLLFDARNPRSVRWQIDAIERHLAGLPDAADRLAEVEGAGLTGTLGVALMQANAAELAAVENNRRPQLDKLLGRIIDRLPKLSNELLRAYVRLTPGSGASPPPAAG